MKKKNNSIELLTDDGWLVVQKMSTKNKHQKHIHIISLSILAIVLLTCIGGFTYSKFINNSSSQSNLKIATWKFKMNSNRTTNLGIDLTDTITENNFSSNSVIPGTNGVINLNIDFSSTKVATLYNITVNNTDTSVPNNLKFYTDKNMTQAFTSFSGNVSLQDIDTIINKKIYWKWYYTEDNENEWQNKEIKLVLTATAEQDVNN